MKNPIVTPLMLSANPTWRIVDCSHVLGDPDGGAQAYTEKHIPGAIHARMEEVLSGPRTGSNGRNPLPDPQRFADWLALHGITPADQVVAYDRSGNAAASRLWWMLRWIGHANAVVLDGGFLGWREAGFETTSEVPEYLPGERYKVEPFSQAHVGLEFVEAHLGDPAVTIIDARAHDRYRGIGETTDPRGGHIPGSLNRPYTLNLDSEGRFKSRAQLAEEWGAFLPETSNKLVMACGSGVSACHNLLALEIAGTKSAVLYPGSWSEWCADPNRPIEQ